MTAGLLSHVDAQVVDREAQSHGFKRKVKRFRFRRPVHFLQLVKLRQSLWVPESDISISPCGVCRRHFPTPVDYKFHFACAQHFVGSIVGLRTSRSFLQDFEASILARAAVYLEFLR